MEPASGPSGGSSALRRYLPLVAVVVVVAVVAVVFAVVSGGGDDSGDDASDTTEASNGTDIPATWFDADADGTVDDYTWQTDCDLDTGRVAVPMVAPPPAPCVPAWEGGDNGGATSSGVTSDTIKVAWYKAEEDPQTVALLQASGAYDPQADVEATNRAYAEMFQALYETYGRTVEIEVLKATGASDDEVAARADAIRAADEMGVFAVLGGPTQTAAFADELASRGVLCVGTCLIAQPEKFYAERDGYIFGLSPTPEQTADHTVELVTKQLKDYPVEYTEGEFQGQPRVFGMLNYDTNDGDFLALRQHTKQGLEAAGIDVAEEVTYFLDLAKAPEDARNIVSQLKEAGVTTVIFAGDPIMPIYFTEEATKQGYFPEWVLSGTVLADTTVLARPYDQQQWAHAFGYSGLQVRIPEEQSAPYAAHEWWFGEPPASENSYGITFANVATLFAGIQLAGPDLTPETFAAGIQSAQPPEQGPEGLRSIGGYRNDELWGRPDYQGLDNATLVFWDPDATGPDESGAEGQGMYRYVDGGRRYLPGEWPSEKIDIFDPAGSVTVYDEVPDELRPPAYPTHPGSPAASSGSG